MYDIHTCKGTVTADSEESYVERFMMNSYDESVIHDCSGDPRIPTGQIYDFNIGRMNYLLYEFRQATKMGTVNNRPLLTSPENLRRLFVEELSYLRCIAIRNVFALYPTANIIKTLKNLRRNMVDLANVCLFSQNYGFNTAYLHTYIDTQFLSLTTCRICSSTTDEITDILYDIMQDMTALAYRTYEIYVPMDDMKTNTPFLCHCHRQLWLLLLKYYERSKCRSESFLDKLNTLLDMKRESSNLFRLWLFRHLYNLELYDSLGEYNSSRSISPASRKLLKNHDEYLQATFNHITSKNPEQLLPALKFTNLLMTDIWIINTSIVAYKTIWEYSYKKMSNGAIEFPIPNTDTGILFLRHSLIFTNDPLIMDPDNALFIFLQILMKHLLRYPEDWQKFQSRFYTRFLPECMCKFHISVVYAVAFIYLTLTKINFTELSIKSLAILDTLLTRTKEHTTAWNIYLALITLHIENNTSINECVDSFMPLILTISADKKQYHLISSLLNCLNGIFATVTYPSKLAVSKLLEGNWLATYMNKCSCTDVIAICDMLEKAIDLSVADTDMWLPLQETLLTYIVPQMELIASDRLDSPVALGVLAAKIAKRSNDATNGIEFYTSSWCLSDAVVMTFMSEFLRSYPDAVTITPNQERALLQAWVRCMLISGPATWESPGFIFKLPSLSCLLANHHIKVDMTKAAATWRLTDMTALFREHGTRYGFTEQLRDLADCCFGSVDVAIRTALERAQNLNSEGSHLVVGIENVLKAAVPLIEDCGPLLLQDLSRLLQVTLLPREVIMANSIKSEWLTAISQAWPLYYYGLKSVMEKVDQPSKATIDGLLHELIVRYIFYYPNEVSPISFMLFGKNTHIYHDLEYVVRHISSEFMLYSYYNFRDQALFFISYLYGRLSNEHGTAKEMVVRSTLAPLMQYVMTCSACKRVHVFDLLKHMNVDNVNPHFVATVDAVTTIIRSKMMFHSEQVMRLLKLLIPEIPNVVKAVLTDVELNISDMERRQGIERNTHLRNHFETLHTSLSLIQPSSASTYNV